MKILRSLLRIAFASFGVLLGIYAFLNYQFVRHSLYNNTGTKVQIYQEHYGCDLAPRDTCQINGLFSTALSNIVLFGNTGLPFRIKFGSNSEIRLMPRIAQIDRKIDLHESWAINRVAWKEYRYQINSDGKIFILPPNAIPPISVTETQPTGFPIF